MTKLTRRHWLIGTGILICLLLGAAWFGWQMLKKNATGQILTDLSDRSQEFIDQERKKSSSSWNQVEFSTPGPQSGDQGSRFSTTCFTISLPFTTRDQKVENTASSCTLAVRVLSPPGRLVIWARPLRSKLDEDTAITLRRLKKDVYTESTLKTTNFGPVLMFQSGDELALFLASKQMLYSFAFTDTTTAKLKESDLQAMLDGFTITLKP